MNLGLAIVSAALIIGGAIIVHGKDQSGGVLIGISVIFIIWGATIHA